MKGLRASILVILSLITFSSLRTAGAVCSTTATGGLVTKSVAGRTYELYVPAGLTAGSNVPLLVTFHGFGSAGLAHASQTNWAGFADAKKFIVAFPNGSFRSWNYRAGSADVTFARQVVADVRATYCVDAARIHASGHSDGAFFAQRIACDAADLFASVSEYAGGDAGFSGGCTPSRAIAVGLFHGDRDVVVPQILGERARDAWVGRNHCSTTPVADPAPNGVAHAYVGCDDGVDVTWRLYSGQGHAWPPEPQSTDLKQRSWDLFLNNPNPWPAP